MNTLDFIIKRYGITWDGNTFAIKIPHSRWREMGALFRSLGFKRGVEVGVYKGHFSKALCTMHPGLELVGVDSWTAYEGYNEYKTNAQAEEDFQEAKARNGKYGVKFIKAFSLDAAREFADESLDFVYIDANHAYEYVVADISAWEKKVRKGGIVCGHDYIKNAKLNFGVIDAVNGWCNSYNIKPLFIWRDRSSSWMYVK